MRQQAVGKDSARMDVRKSHTDLLKWDCRWKIDKWSPDQVQDAASALDVVPKSVDTTALERLGLKPAESLVVEGNLLLNTGIQLLLDLLIGGGGTVASNANAQIGVGNSNTAAAATQTALQGGSTLYKGMLATFPARTDQTMDFRSEFIDGEAEFAWEEWAIRNESTAAVLLNRKVESLGTKAAGSVWTITGSITIS